MSIFFRAYGLSLTDGKASVPGLAGRDMCMSMRVRGER